MNSENTIKIFCRTCLSSLNPNMCLLNETTTYGITLEDILLDCCTLQSDVTNMPQSICISCKSQLLTVYKFRKQCEESDMILHSYLTNNLCSTNDNKIFVISPNCEIVMKDEPSDDAEELQQPEASVPINESHKCPVCFRIFDQLKILKEHLEAHDHGSNKLFACKDCGKCFKKYSNLRKHENEHQGTKLSKCAYKCNVCQLCFNSNPQLEQHLQTHEVTKPHPEKPIDRPYSCTICDSSFKRNYNLIDHMRIHSGEKPFQCTICDNSFAKKDYLNKHMRKHTGVKQYTCSVCDTAFKHEHHLKVHLRTHTVEKPYPCTLCDGAFAKKDYLTKHMRTHTVDKPYSCMVCDSAFKHQHHLKIHMRTHTGEKPYSCTVCDCSFKLQHHLKYHMRKHAV